MRRLVLPAMLALAAVFMIHPALAQAVTGTGNTSGSNASVTWSMLDPGSDWAADMIRSLFPMFTNSDGTATPSAENTVIGKMLGELTAFVGAIALIFVSYSVIMQIHRGAETSKLLGTNQTSMSVVRIGFAAILMFPIPGGAGFSVGQQLVVQCALMGVGMAKTVYTNAVTGLAPGGQVIAQPMVPGTATVVAGLIRNELCRDLVNAESAQSLVVEPSPVTTTTSSGEGMISFNYNLSSGNGNGTPACGSVSVRTPNANAKNILGVSVDMASKQSAVLSSVLSTDIQGQVQTVANAFYNNKTSNSLAALSGIFTNASKDYRSQLTTAATDVQKSLQDAIQTASSSSTQADQFLNNTSANQAQIAGFGWSAAGAYYLEFARLNAQTLSLMSGTPVISSPTYAGLGADLSKDLAPLVQSSEAYLDNIQAYANTNDGIDAPNGNAELMLGSVPGSDGSSALDSAARALHLNDYVLQFATYLMSPPSAWQDPFGTLMQLGNTMILVALGALGMYALLSSPTASAVSVVFGLLSAQPEVAAGAAVGHMVVAKLGAFIMTGCMALLVPGLTIAYVLPMIPFTMWIAGVIGWLIMVCEGVIAVPLWMLAHMATQGEGLHGKAQEGYALLFNIIFRPVLMLFGLFLGYFIFDAACWLIRQTFGIAAGAVLGNGWFVTNLLGVIVLLAIFVLLHVVAALLSFRMISLVPHHVPRMIGFSDGGRVDLDQFSRDAALVGVGKTLDHVSRQAYGLLPEGPKKGNLSREDNEPRRLSGSSDSTIRGASDDGGGG